MFIQSNEYLHNPGRKIKPEPGTVGTPGSVKIVEFTLLGPPFMAISAGPLDSFNHSIPFIVRGSG
jgi:predicted 3-demethylubiquinone-9 3-methyltransferase (glyoxalase superfamily)